MPPRRKRTTSTATIFATASLLFPAITLAQVRITEVMYDAPGADTGREWVEVANLGSQNADIGKYKLFENATNHGLNAVQGGNVLAPNGVAIIADDAQKFFADYPAFSGTVFDSTFSLSNTGETLALKDASSTAIDTASYVETDAANGTGGTLNLSRAGEWIPAMASPGIYPGPMTPVPAAKTPATKIPSVKAPAKTAAAKGSSTNNSSNAPSATYANTDDAASADLSLPAVPPLVLWIGALAAIVLAGIAGIFFVLMKGSGTSLSQSEFTIE